MPTFVGILNLTEDSFSDGGRFLDPQAAIAHGEALVAGGADILDIGAESSNPAGKPVPIHAQVTRLDPVVRHFIGRGVRVSIDTHRAEVMHKMIELGVDLVNDITALGNPLSAGLLAAHPHVEAVLMFARNPEARAETAARPAAGVMDDVVAFFRRRLDELASVGVAPERLILDPGMGFFLGGTPEPSLEVLRGLPKLAALGRPVYVSTSRKSFIGTLLGGKAPTERGAGTLATELWALTHGADFVRTHDVRPLREAYTVWRTLAG